MSPRRCVFILDSAPSPRLRSRYAEVRHGIDAHIHRVDTPGYPDFLGQSLNALAAVETAAVVINTQNGIEMITQRMAPEYRTGCVAMPRAFTYNRQLLPGRSIKGTEEHT